jgi:hypothetical protein
MGDETTLMLVGVTVRPDRRKPIEVLLKKQAAARKPGLRLLFRQLCLTPDNSIEFRLSAKDDVATDEVPDEAGYVSSIWGKWYEAEALAEWLCRHCAEGRVIQHSREGDGGAWGWEFRGGRIRRLSLEPSGPWKRFREVWRGGASKRAQ